METIFQTFGNLKRFPFYIKFAWTIRACLSSRQFSTKYTYTHIVVVVVAIHSKHIIWHISKQMALFSCISYHFSKLDKITDYREMCDSITNTHTHKRIQLFTTNSIVFHLANRLYIAIAALLLNLYYWTSNTAKRQCGNQQKSIFELTQFKPLYEYRREMKRSIANNNRFFASFYRFSSNSI